MKRIIMFCFLILMSTMFNSVSYAENNDLYYIDFLKAIGTDIEVKYDNESLELGVSRGQFIALAAQAIKLKSNDYVQQYWDVDAENKYSGYITAMTDIGYVSGYGDGSFRPGSKISLGEAYTIAVNVLGYKLPKSDFFTISDVMRIVGDLELDKDVKGEMSLRNAYIILYNMLNAKAADMSFVGSSVTTSVSDETLLYKLYELECSEGIYEGEWPWSISKNVSLPKGCVSIDGTILNSDKTFKEYLGYKVKYFYDKEDYQLVFAYRKPKQESIRIEAKDIYKYSDMTLYYDKNGSTRNIKFTTSTDFVYNGVGIDYNTEFSENLFEISEGYIEAIDNNNDGRYEVALIIESYDIVVQSAYTKGDLYYIYDKYNTEKTLAIDVYDDNVYAKCFDADGKNYEITTISKGDILTVYKSYDDSVVEMYISSDINEGSVSGVSENTDGGFYLNINEKIYETTFDFSQDILVGKDGVIYFDINGKIAYIEYFEVSDYTIGLLVKTYNDENDETVYLRLISKKTDGVKTIKCAEKVNVDGVYIKKCDDIYTAINQTEADFPVVVRYVENDEGEIITIDTPHVGDKEIDNCIIHRNPDSKELFCKSTTKTLQANYTYSDDTVVFSVPDDLTNYADYHVVDTTRLKNDETMTIDVYSIGNEGFNSIALVVPNSGPSASYKNICVVSRVYIGLNEDDEVVHFVETFSGLKSATSFVRQEDYSLIENIDRGDIVRISQNINSEIDAIIKVYDYESDEWTYSSDGETILTNPTSTYLSNAYFRCMLTKAYKISDGYVGLVNRNADINTITDKDIEIYEYSGSWYIYEVLRDRVNIRRVELEEIVEGKHSLNDASDVIMQMKYSQPEVAYVISRN